MERTVRTGALLVVLSFGLGTAVRAQAPGGHTHAAAHGGEVMEVAKHHVEFKAEPSGVITIWLLDAGKKAMAPPAGGRVTLMPEGSEQVTIPLKAEPDSQRLVAQFDPKLKAFQAVVSLPIEGKRRNFRFHYPPSHH